MAVLLRSKESGPKGFGFGLPLGEGFNGLSPDAKGVRSQNLGFGIVEGMEHRA